MKKKQQRVEFGLLEVVTVTVVLAVVGVAMPAALGRASKEANVTTCVAHLREIGQAIKIYEAEYGQYPDNLPWMVATGLIERGRYLKDKESLFCPEDTRIKVPGAASSYIWRGSLPPDFTVPFKNTRELDPNIVLVVCDHHQGQRVIYLGDHAGVTLTPPNSPFHLVLRADGRVERVPISRIRHATIIIGGRRCVADVYPGEPGYEKLER